MALTKVTSGAVTGLATSATTDTTDASNITTGTIPTARLDSTLDLSSKTVTLPAASVTAHATNPTKASIEALGIDLPAADLTGTISDARLGTVSASKLSGALPAIDGSSLTNLPGGGKVLQVVQSSFSGTISWSSYNDITGSGVAITPSSTTSKILVMIESSGTQTNQASNGAVRLWVQSSEVASRTAYAGGHGIRNLVPLVLNVIHSPNTTSSVTYYAQFEKRNAGGLGTANFGAKGSITLMEVSV